MRDFPLVDAHHHIWDLSVLHYPWLTVEPPPPFRYGDTRPLRRSYLPQDYARDSAGWDLRASVFVEAEADPADPLAETRWVSQQALRAGLPSVIVAQAWLDRPEAAALLAAQAAFPLVRGVRHKPRAAARPELVERGAPGSLGDPAWRRGYGLLARHGLSFDLQTPWWHLAEARALAEDFPETPMVLDHAGLPSDRSPEGLAAWRAALAELAKAPNVAVKISGLGQPGLAWSAEANRRVVLTAIELFGTERAMFASNYPVDSLVASFDRIFEGFAAIVADFPPAERRRLFHDNAARLYRIAL